MSLSKVHHFNVGLNLYIGLDLNDESMLEELVLLLQSGIRYIRPQVYKRYIDLVE